METDSPLCAYPLIRYNPPPLHDGSKQTYGERVAQATGQQPRAFAKTLAVETERGPALVVLPVLERLDWDRLKKALGVSSAHLMRPDRVNAVTGMIPGGVSPLLRQGSLPTLMGASLFDCDEIVVSAGEVGLAVKLAPTVLQQLTASSIIPAK